MYDEFVDEISVCVDCMIEHANGDIDPDRPADMPPVWGLIGFGYSVTMGGQHAEGCPNGIDGPRDTDCDCDSLGFSWHACEGCGSNLGGDRFKFTLWRVTVSHAQEQARYSIGFARQKRESRNIEFAHASLTAAASWRGYIRDRFAEQHEHDKWMARNAVAVSNGFA